MDEMLAQRDKLNAAIQQILDANTAAWGMKVTNVEIQGYRSGRDHDPRNGPAGEAERGRRAKVIHAEGEKQAAETLAEAAKILSREPASLQTALSANAGRHFRRKEFDHRVPICPSISSPPCCKR